MTAIEWSLLLTLSALWGGSFFFYKVLVGELPVLTIVLGRVGIAAALMQLATLSGRDHVPFTAQPWRQFAVMALLNNVVPFSLIAFAEKHIPSGLASILNATTPMFTVIVAHRFGDERLTAAKTVGVTLGFAGVALLLAPRLAGASAMPLAVAACLAAALLYACAAIYGRRFRSLPPMVVAAGQVTASTLILLPFAAWLDRPWTLAPHLTTIAALLGLALLCTAWAYQIYFRLLATAGATNLLLVTLLSPMSAVLLGAAFLSERIGWAALAALLTIGLGLAAIDGRALLFLRRRLSPRAAGEELR
jgi:drug/metabolite transporter (DMT)-like permease